jgi:hypothetical protein
MTKEKSILSNLAAPEQLGIDFRDFGQEAKEFRVGGDAGAGIPALLRRLEQELPGPVNPKALDDVEERPVLPPPTVAAAILLAACQILLDA